MFHLASVSFLTLGSGSARVVGDIVTLASSSGADLSSTSTAAADVTFPVTGGSASGNPSWAPVAKAVATPNCSSGAVPGDANGDCVLDMRDVAAHAQFILATAAERAAVIAQVGASALDVNIDLAIDTADLAQLLQAQVGLAPLVQAISVEPVSRSNDCFLEMYTMVQLHTGTRGTVAVSDADFRVLFLLEKTGVNLTVALDGTTL
jgi:hypothetical protein